MLRKAFLYSVVARHRRGETHEFHVSSNIRIQRSGVNLHKCRSFTIKTLVPKPSALHDIPTSLSKEFPSMKHSQTSVSKPFAGVPLPDSVSRGHPARHDRYYDSETHTTGRIEGIIKALSPIHVGSGIIDFAQEIDPAQDIEQGQDIEIIKTVVRKDRIAIIPGASLKGAIRSVVEAISQSCVCKTDKDTSQEIPEDFVECERRQRERANLCVACCMFGAMGFQGNVAIQDAPQISGKIVTKFVPELHSREPDEIGTRDTPMRKFYKHGAVASGDTAVEVCEAGSKFRFVVRIDNLTQAEWGLLFTALGHHPCHPFKLKIGGAKPVCFGSTDFQIKKIYIDGKIRDRYLAWDSQQGIAKMGTELEDWKMACINKASDSLIEKSLLKELAQILYYPNNRDCPSGTY